MTTINGSDENRAIALLIPMWIKGMAGILVTAAAAILVGGGAWAWSMNAKMAELVSDTKAMKEIGELRFAVMKDRIDRMDERAP